MESDVPTTSSTVISPNPEDYTCMRMDEEPTPLAPKYNNEWPKIVCFGDSMTRFGSCHNVGAYASMLQHRVGDFYDVDLRGFSGYSTREASQIMNRLFTKKYLERVDVFVEFFGHNDSWTNYPFQRTLQEFQANVESMYTHLIENGLKPSQIICVTPCFYDNRLDAKITEEWKLLDRSKNFGKTLETATLFNEAKMSIARRMNISIVDMLDASQKYNPDHFFDGIHLSTKGAEIFCNSYLFPIIDEKIERIHGKPLYKLFHCMPVENLPEFQNWAEFEPADYP